MRLIFTRCLQAINGVKKLLVSKVSIDVNGYITGRVADDSADQPLIYAGSGHHRDHCMPGVMRRVRHLQVLQHRIPEIGAEITVLVLNPALSAYKIL